MECKKSRCEPKAKQSQIIDCFVPPYGGTVYGFLLSAGATAPAFVRVSHRPCNDNEMNKCQY
ncbi:MAG: hypothetical protein COV74_02930 [Candidatus Omnitrophica bacterium CG11_big_fil_rev_8_21_14_0_20_45_26]|uniref:Uncharacterized protein n=1 Tax=Candidatus Abzuiibacterium crystallinum TaxID=1974748 RepID=A0A2H0LR30_9BACT|nr:MAG: hypothetical protein COV74_02930 [Candidatus Omnitrophica bacterium CG11_big_fil_rev_8_21_14_0_20_45_26]PIW65596.1 MAG: hypothetical protein COW12_01060 [Candidatus Omnitrophica bacterium CG12_big_fil_rev_8_21_14_0_65_45_16]